MPSTISTTRWRDEPIVPEGYEDVAALVDAARKARGRIVEFDWIFTRDDLLRLQRAVYEWGTTVAGRYKCFDARVLAAINDVLDATNSPLALKEPRGSEAVDCKASCIVDGDCFRLRGHASFDIVYGYGSAGMEQDPEYTVRLGPKVRETLVGAVEMLGWDLHRLQEERFKAVGNVLYGLAMDYGISETEPVAGPAIDVDVHFQGPFSLVDDGRYRCLFTAEIADLAGVYLWTINVGGEERTWYVGQTRRGFGERMNEHLSGILSGGYTTYDAEALSRGEHRLASDAIGLEWPQSLLSFLRHYETLVPNLIGVIRLINIHVAPLPDDTRLYDRVEGAIGRHYKAHPDPQLRDFLMPGLRVPAAIPGEKPIRLVLSSEGAVAGLPQHILA